MAPATRRWSSYGVAISIDDCGLWAVYTVAADAEEALTKVNLYAVVVLLIRCGLSWGLVIDALAVKMARSLSQVLQNAAIRPAQGKASAAVRETRVSSLYHQFDEQTTPDPCHTANL